MIAKRQAQSIKASKQRIETSKKRTEASREAAAKFLVTQLDLTLEFAETAFDADAAGNRDDAKRAKAAARKGYRTVQEFMPEESLSQAERKVVETKLKKIEQALKKIRRV
jgi:hypothetical protein